MQLEQKEKSDRWKMSIGLYDEDMVRYTLVPFNLELMKLSTHFKKKREIVILSPSFSPERHQKFILRKDYDDGIYVPNMESIKNLDYGGYAFSGENYSPLELNIEKARPDTSLYEKMESKFINYHSKPSKEREKIFKNLMTAEHGRLSLDGKTIWSDYEKQFKYLPSARNIILHDYDLGRIENGFEEVKSILSRARTDGWATKIGMKFPVQVSNGKDLLKWASLNPNSSFYSLRFNGVVDEDNFIEFIGRSRQRAIFTQLDYYITNNSFDENDFIKNWLRKIYRQVIISRSYKVFFTLKYEQDFFVHKEWEDVIELFNYYHNSLKNMGMQKYLSKISSDTMFDFAKNTTNTPYNFYGHTFTRDKIRKIFYFVHDNYPELLDDFYNCNLLALQQEGLRI